MKLFSIVTLLIVLFQLTSNVCCYEMRYKVCTVGELHKYVDNFCQQYGCRRNKNSNLEVSAYGSVSLTDDNSYVGKENLLSVLRASKLFSTRAQLISDTNSRDRRSSESRTGGMLCDYIASCCQQSCVIAPEDLLPQCCSTDSRR